MAKKFTDPKKVKVKKSSAGLGLFADEDIFENEFVIEYFGEVLTRRQADERGGMYLFETSANRVIDGKARSNIARYINHSCDANCDADIFNGRVVIIANRDIKKGEELSFDYGEEMMEEYINPRGCKCAKCGA